MVSDKEITLGEFLRHERESRGITLEQVASTTKIGVRTLHALEADHYAELPAKPFIRGFVTSYCRFIGIDAADILSRFDQFVNVKALERPSRESGHSGYAFDKKDGEQQSRTILTIAVASFICLGGIVLIFFKPVLSRHRSTQVEQLRAASEVLPAVSPTVSPGTTPSQPAPPLVAINNEKKDVLQTGVGSPSESPPPSLLPSSSPTPPPPEPEPQEPVKKTPEPEASSVTNAVVALPSPPEAETQVSPLEEPVASASAPVSTKIGANPEDPLDSGVGLKNPDLKHKVNCKMLEDNWVRYQVDDRPIRKFIVRKGKVLVLRARKQIVLQVSHPEGVSLNYNSQNSVLLSEDPQAAVRNGDWTISFPPGSKFPFEHEKRLPKRVDATPHKKVEEPAPETGPTT